MRKNKKNEHEIEKAAKCDKECIKDQKSDLNKHDRVGKDIMDNRINDVEYRRDAALDVEKHAYEQSKHLDKGAYETANRMDKAAYENTSQANKAAYHQDKANMAYNANANPAYNANANPAYNANANPAYNTNANVAYNANANANRYE